MNDSGRSLTEAVGGFWQGVNEDAPFVPLNELVNDKRLQQILDGEVDMSDLVFETELNTGEGVKQNG